MKYAGIKSFNNNSGNLNASLQHLDRTGFAGNTASRQATVAQQPESTWSGRNAKELNGTQPQGQGSTGIAGVHAHDTFESPQAAQAPTSPLTSAMRLTVGDHLQSGASLPSLGGLSALLAKAGLRRDTPLAAHDGLAEPLSALAERYPAGDVRRELLLKVAAGDQTALQTLMKKRAG